MKLKKPKGRKFSSSGESDRNIKFVIAGSLIGIFLLGYIYISIKALSDDAAAVFAGLANSDSSALNYNFELFETIFPGELETIRGGTSIIDASAVSASSTATTTDSTSTAEIVIDSQASTSTDSSSPVDDNEPDV